MREVWVQHQQYWEGAAEGSREWQREYKGAEMVVNGRAWQRQREGGDKGRERQRV